MKIQFSLNGKKITDEIAVDMPLLEYLREKGCYSVKRGCETSNCGLCTVLMDGKPVLSCTTLAVRAVFTEHIGENGRYDSHYNLAFPTEVTTDSNCC